MSNNDLNSQQKFQFKIVLVGNLGVGKSSLLMRFTDDLFTENLVTTLGVDFKTKTISIDSQIIKL
jgi:Ras-related protein Rab-1A